MAEVSIQDIKELMEFFEKPQKERHEELRNDLHRFIDKSDKRLRVLEKVEIERVVLKRKSNEKVEAFKSYWKPILISLITAVLVGGITYYGS